MELQLSVGTYAQSSCYMSPENVIVENGLLRLKAENKRHLMLLIRLSMVERPIVWISSGVVTTKDKFEFTHGYVEARIRVPSGNGFGRRFGP